MAIGVENILGKFDKTTKSDILKLNYFTQKDFRETVQGLNLFVTIFSAIYVGYMRFLLQNLVNFELIQSLPCKISLVISITFHCQKFRTKRRWRYAMTSRACKECDWPVAIHVTDLS